MASQFRPGRRQFLVGFGYDGARFWGLAPQRDFPTAAEALRARLESAAGQRARALQFTTRTDRGVHAIENLATFWLLHPEDVDAFTTAVSAEREDGLRQVWAREVDVHVHARNLSRGKHYRYTLRMDGEADPLAWTIEGALDVQRMSQAADRFKGTHDFSSFRFKCTSPNTVKTLTRVDITPVDTGLVIDIEGDAFLRKMVRKLVATLVEVGRGELGVDEVDALLDAPPPRRSPDAAPAQGLCLIKVLRD